MKPKVYVTRQIFPRAIERLMQFCELVVNEKEDPPSYEEMLGHVADKDGILCFVGDRIDRGCSMRPRVSK